MVLHVDDVGQLQQFAREGYAPGTSGLRAVAETPPAGVLVGELVRRPNDRLRAARVQRLSPSGSGRPLSRQELADLVNRQLAAWGFRHAVLDGTYVGKLERGEHRWPQAAYRSAFRAVLGVSDDAVLGFFITRRQR